MQAMSPQFWSGHRDLLAEARDAHEQGDIDADELDSRLEFLADLERDAREIG